MEDENNSIENHQCEQKCRSNDKPCGCGRDEEGGKILIFSDQLNWNRVYVEGENRRKETEPHPASSVC